MRSQYNETLKTIIHIHLLQARETRELTQAAMAELLMMDVRSYVELDHEKSLCGTLTLVLFLIYCCLDPVAVLQEIRVSFDGLRDSFA